MANKNEHQVDVEQLLLLVIRTTIVSSNTLEDNKSIDLETTINEKGKAVSVFKIYNDDELETETYNVRKAVNAYNSL